MSPIESLNPDLSFKHWIAYDLRFFRERERLSLAQMGRIMSCNRHNVSNIEHARDGWNMQEHHADRLDAYLRLPGHFARLVRYARTAHDPDWFVDYVKHEAKARVIRLFRLSLIPGLFQTPEYARAVITAFQMVDDVEAAVQSRMKRYEVVSRMNPPRVWVLLDEGVLRRPVGDTNVMCQQLTRLLDEIESKHVTIRVVPESAGAYLGLDGSFNSLTMERGELAFVEAPGGGRLIQGGKEASDFLLHWDQIGACALPWDASRDLIIKATERFS